MKPNIGDLLIRDDEGCPKWVGYIVRKKLIRTKKKSPTIPCAGEWLFTVVWNANDNQTQRYTEEQITENVGNGTWKLLNKNQKLETS